MLAEFNRVRAAMMFVIVVHKILLFHLSRSFTLGGFGALVGLGSRGWRWWKTVGVAKRRLLGCAPRYVDERRHLIAVDRPRRRRVGKRRHVGQRRADLRKRPALDGAIDIEAVLGAAAVGSPGGDGRVKAGR